MLPPHIDEIVFGNPSKQDYQNMQVPGYLDSLLDELKTFLPPPNSSDETKQELIVLLRYTKSTHISRKELFDKMLIPHLNDLFVRNGAKQEEVCEITESIVKDVLPIITKLKYHYQRPRPYQLAYYYPEMELYPDFSHFVSSPAYPSGHGVMGLVAGHVLGNLYPESHSVMKNFMREILQSRLALGVHYPTDNQFAETVALAIVSHPEFQHKYDL